MEQEFWLSLAVIIRAVEKYAGDQELTEDEKSSLETLRSARRRGSIQT